MAGQKYGAWAVIRQAGNTSGGAALWLSRCSCGTERVVLGVDLRNGKSTGCGCVGAARIGALKRSHGGSGTRLYNIWKCMKARCHYPGSTEFARYGAKGIKVCDEWLGFIAFRDWALASGYNDVLSIDRLDNAADYRPENCRWATPLEQSSNRDFVARTSDGRVAWHVAQENGISRDAFYCRKREGWNIDDAATVQMNGLRP